MKTTRRLVILAVLGLPLVVQVEPGAAATTTIPVAADAYVHATEVTKNTGGYVAMRVRNDDKVSYLRFDVPPSTALGGAVTRAKLRVYASTDTRCSLGLQVWRAANSTWSESTITYSNQPGAAGAVLATTVWSVPGYVEVDVTPAVTAGVRVSLMLQHASGCAVSSDVVMNTRESTSNRPQLVVETAATAAPACSDGRDNDADGKLDYPADTGCTSASDTDETNVATGTNIVAAAGDIVCSPSASNFGGSDPTVCQHRATQTLLTGTAAILPVGDIQYEDGSLAQFQAGYDPSWGTLASKTFPAVGNHEYHVPGAAGYFDYWASKGRPTGGKGAGYYSFDLGAWHLISLNSNCNEVSCSEGSAQDTWLERDLAANTKNCILAYYHHPLFNSGSVHGGGTPTKGFWADLYAARADLVVNGHEHNYQRYAKQTPTGHASPTGIREFISGAGGKSHYGLLSNKDPNFQFGNTTSFGVLKLSLEPSSYRWQFVTIGGTVIDSGGPVACN